VTGRAWVTGVHAIVITGHPVTTGLPRGMVRATKARVRPTLYIDPSTYLPVRAYGSTTSFGGGARPFVDWNVSNISWLTPAKARIARCIVRVPRGFPHVASVASQQP
jgi:hypothetical protein